MMSRGVRAGILGAVMSLAAAPGWCEGIRHDLTLAFDPAAHRIESVDAVTLPPSAGSPVRFLLHAGLEPRSATPGVTLARLSHEPRPDDFAAGEPPLDLEGAGPVELWEIRARAPVETITIRYAGVIHHPVEATPRETARGFSDTPGTIGPEGIFLTGASFWVPWFGEARGLVTFSIEAKLPAGWGFVTAADPAPPGPRGAPGARAVCDTPQEDVTFVAGAFTRYERRDGRVLAEAYLREPDSALAGKYLEATGRYIAMYERLFGPYPFGKFALVENFWETGYGFPSFTLLGPKVVRFPFILTSSFPHEILHDWWGNGVFVDRSTGNWCEGLTAYLADHLFAEQQGRAAESRQGTLQGWADYTREAKDFPLAEFRERHSAATEAVGYGKSLMLFHDIRRRIGDEAFVRALAAFFEAHRFRRAGFADLRAAFEAASGTGLGPVFAQAVERPGAPSLAVSNVEAVPGEGGGWTLRGLLRQSGVEPPWDLVVPVAVTMEGKPDAREVTIPMTTASRPFELALPARPVRMDIDPAFDLFRRLDPRETPPAFSSLFGASRPLVVLPTRAPAPVLAAYRAAARSWADDSDEGDSGPGEPAGGGLEIRSDDELTAIPPGRTVWIFGWENRLLPAGAPLFEKAGAALSPAALRIGDGHWDKAGRSVAMSVRADAAGERAVGFFAADSAAAIPGLARKLPHYHRYGWLVFEGDEPVIAAKGKWAAADSPLTVLIDGGANPGQGAPRGELAEREALAQLPPSFSAERMMATVTTLAGSEMKGRGLGTPELDRAAELIASGFAEAGLAPWGASFNQDFERNGPTAGGGTGRARVRNVVGLIRGTDPALAGEILVVGAHYDHLGLGWPDVKAGNAGKIHPGADDNASGVAVLIELARALAGSTPRRSIVFAAFSGEEAGLAGSKEFVRQLGANGTTCRSMINLDTVGRLGAGKLLVLGTNSATEWPHIFQGASYVTGVPVEIVAGDPGASDQMSFRDAGVPAVQLFTGAHADYHTPADTAGRVDGPGLVRVAAVVKEAVDYLADRPGPLTVPASASAASPATGGPARRATLGSIPDYSFAGPGVMITGTTPGSPAEQAGLQAGDVLLALDGREIAGLRNYSDLLATHSPGDRVKITIRRGAETLSIEATLAAR